MTWGKQAGVTAATNTHTGDVGVQACCAARHPENCQTQLIYTKQINKHTFNPLQTQQAGRIVPADQGRLAA